MKITMQQIAEMAGVTRATVDKIVHNRPGVSARTKERVQKIISEYNYTPPNRTPSIKRSSLARLAIITLPPTHDYYMEELKAGMDYQLNLYHDIPLQAEYYFCNASDPQSLVSIVSYLETQEIDALAIRGMNYPEVNAYICSLTSKNIPVITFDSDLPSSDRLCFVGEDLRGTGQVAASLMAEIVGETGKVAVIGSSMNTNSTSERIAGFTDYMQEEHPNIDLLDVIETLDQRSLTYSKVYDLLKEHPDLKGIWNSVSCNEDMVQAVIDSGKSQDIKLISLTFSPAIISLIKQNLIKFTLGLTPRKLGKIVIQTIYEYLFLGQTPPSKHIQTPIYIASKANIDNYRPF